MALCCREYIQSTEYDYYDYGSAQIRILAQTRLHDNAKLLLV